MGIGRLIPYLVWDGIGLGGWGMRAVAVVVAGVGHVRVCTGLESIWIRADTNCLCLFVPPPLSSSSFFFLFKGILGRRVDTTRNIYLMSWGVRVEVAY